MSLDVMQYDGDVEDPTDHPHVFEERAPPLNDEDPDAQRYVLSFNGSRGAVKFFAAIVKDRIDEDLYRYYENTPDSKPSFSGITEDDIGEMIEAFDETVEDINDIKLSGDINGTEWSMTIWDGIPNDPDYLTP